MPVALSRRKWVSLSRICSRFKIPEIARLDGKTGKMLIGYARVSTADQELALQTDALMLSFAEN